MAAYRRGYGFVHLQADCPPGPGSFWYPTFIVSMLWDYLYLCIVAWLLHCSVWSCCDYKQNFTFVARLGMDICSPYCT